MTTETSRAHDADPGPHGFCAACGRPLSVPPPQALSDDTHRLPCTTSPLEAPRFCRRCGRRLDVQVLPTGYRATCRRCDGVHPAHAPVRTSD